MARRSAAEAAMTREAIIGEAVAMASVEGLEGITIGRLAEAVGMSKAGVLNHFPTKEHLQLATLDSAIAHFSDRILEPLAGMPDGLEKLLGLLEAWLSYLDDPQLIGGCFVSGVSHEFDARGGAVGDRTREMVEGWLAVLEIQIEAAVEGNELGKLDPAQTAFELNGLGLAANQVRQLLGDSLAIDRARVGIRHVLGLAEP